MFIPVCLEYYGKCTWDYSYGCHREGKYGFLNPIMSARLNTKASITYGKVEVVAKLPRGDWIWPGKAYTMSKTELIILVLVPHWSMFFCNSRSTSSIRSESIFVSACSLSIFLYSKRGDIWSVTSDSLVVAIWMLPSYGGRHGEGPYGNWPQSGEIDIMESRGNRNYGNLGIEYMASTLHWGSQGVNKFQLTSTGKKVKWNTLADGYHKFTFYWDPSGME